jgi:hypothetical protein
MKVAENKTLLGELYTLIWLDAKETKCWRNSHEGGHFDNQLNDDVRKIMAERKQDIHVFTCNGTLIKTCLYPEDL